jgi:hypothetical protein
MEMLRILDESGACVGLLLGLPNKGLPVANVRISIASDGRSDSCWLFFFFSHHFLST